MLLAFKVGLPQRPSERNGQKGRVRSQLVPSLVPMPAQTAAKMRGSPPTALECSAETDSALERTGFELAVPLRWTALRSEVVEEAFGSARYDERGRPQRPAVSACAIP